MKVDGRPLWLNRGFKGSDAPRSAGRGFLMLVMLLRSIEIDVKKACACAHVLLGVGRTL